MHYLVNENGQVMIGKVQNIKAYFLSRINFNNNKINYDVNFCVYKSNQIFSY